MLKVKIFEFNPFQENTYVVYNEENACIIFDPGCYNQEDDAVLFNFIEDNNLIPERLINTHCHLDHIFGNDAVAKKYNLGLEIHEGELPVLEYAVPTANMYAVKLTPSPKPSKFLKEGDTVQLGADSLEVLFTPGHSPASISFYSAKHNFLIAGDVLFRDSIGRSDLPGGDHETLLKTIREKFYSLPDETVVYAGHGPETTIGYEKKNNPFVRA